MFRNPWLAALLLLAAAAALARYHDRIAIWLAPEPPPRPFVFDNGSVREPVVATPQPLARQNGTLKRCERNGSVTYTDQPCDAGARARAVGGVLSVVEPHPVPRAAPAPASGAQAALRRALDVDGPSLRERQPPAAP